nr:salivary gland-specific hypothetical protein 1 - fruit fly (Drosophila melanogaster) (strain Samarkand) [Drosophila melanogaster]
MMLLAVVPMWTMVPMMILILDPIRIMIHLLQLQLLKRGPIGRRLTITRRELATIGRRPTITTTTRRGPTATTIAKGGRPTTTTKEGIQQQQQQAQEQQFQEAWLERKWLKQQLHVDYMHNKYFFCS